MNGPQAAMVALLVEEGRLSPAWRPSFERVPRHLFVPDVAWVENWAEPIDRQVDPEAWMVGTYVDKSLVTQWDDGSDEPNEDSRPTSSLSMPYMVAGMLEACLFEDGMNVLEIGTGSGWNAALLADRLGTDSVHTIEIDPLLADRARAALRDAGVDLAVITGDGAEGYPPSGLYDRILSTCAVTSIPPAWLDQVKPGGYIVTPFEAPAFSGLLARLQVRGDGGAIGRFVETAAFMLMRGQRRREDDVPVDWQAPSTRTGIYPRAIFNNDHAQVYVALAVPDCWQWRGKHIDGEVMVRRLDDIRSGSWAVITESDWWPDGHTVQQGGPRRLWDEVVAAYHRWIKAGSPPFGRFGLTVRKDGWSAWLDDETNILGADRR